MNASTATETTVAPVYDEVGAMMAFENDELDRAKTIELFQHLVDSGLAWRLQGFYGRAAEQLIGQGLVKADRQTKTALAARRR